MRSLLPILLIVSACGAPADEAQENATANVPAPSGPPIIQQADSEIPDTAVEGAARWESATGESGTGLRFVDKAGTALLGIFCPEARTRLVVSVPSFKAIGSEDRFSLALGQEPVTLVADPTLQKAGVNAEGAVPENLKALLEKADRIGALYGNQRAGPYPAPPKALVEALAEACGA